MDAKVSNGQHIGRWTDGENLGYGRWSSIKELSTRKKRTINRGQKSKAQNDVKLVENISQNFQGFQSFQNLQGRIQNQENYDEDLK